MGWRGIDSLNICKRYLIELGQLLDILIFYQMHTLLMSISQKIGVKFSL